MMMFASAGCMSSDTSTLLTTREKTKSNMVRMTWIQLTALFDFLLVDALVTKFVICNQQRIICCSAVCNGSSGLYRGCNVAPVVHLKFLGPAAA